MPHFYKVDHRKITLGEYWNLSPNWKGILAWLMKTLGHPLSGPNVYTQPLSSKEFELPEDQLPAEHATAMSEVRKQLETLGLHSLSWSHMPALYGNVSLATGAFRHDSGRCVARVIHSRATSGTITIEQVVTAFLSLLKDGRVLVTTDMRPAFRGGPPNFIVERRVGASPSALLEEHLKRLSAIPEADIQPIQTTPQCDAFVDDYERQAFDFNLRRGLYVTISQEELAQKETEKAATETALAEGQKYPQVLAEIERVRNKKASWTSALWILGVSIVLFVALGAFRWSWQTVAILVGVLFFHELGHYFAMRAFNYQNLRMFFIPLLGAAVSGRNYNVKGWQKAIVSLAGPVPGIIVGAALGIFAIVADNPWASRVALMALVLNGINLLPVLPLDGGWLMHTLVFCRRYWLEGAFHVLAALIMIGYRFAGGEKFWLFLGIFMLFTSPTAFRMARIAHRLKARGLSTVSQDQQTIPRETAETIIDEIKASLPGNHTDKTLATLTLNTFEKLNATPPSIGASVLLFIVYIGSLAVALVFAGVLIVAGPGKDLAPAALSQPVVPHLEYSCNTTRQVGQISGVPASMLISTYDNRAEAEEAFADIRDSTNEVGTLFGQTIFRAVPHPKASSTNSKDMIERPLSNQLAMVFVSCLAADEASAIALTNELQAYFDVAQVFLIPPAWTSVPEVSAEDRAARKNTWRTYQRIQGDFETISRDPKYKQLVDELFRMSGKKTQAAREKAFQQLATFSREFKQRKLLELKEQKVEYIDKALIAIYLREPGDYSRPDYQSWRDELGVRLGKASQTDQGLPTTESGWYALKLGSMRRQGATVHLEHLLFRRTDLGLPALVEFLCSKSCSDIRYALQSPEHDEDN